jgi:hypothetical protein
MLSHALNRKMKAKTKSLPSNPSLRSHTPVGQSLFPSLLPPSTVLLGTTASAAVLKHLPLYHDPLVANVDEHFKLLYELVFLRELRLQVLNLLLRIFLQLVVVFPRLCQLFPQIGSDALFGRRMRFAVYRRPVLSEARSHLLWIPIDGGARVVNVAGQKRNVGVLILQDFKRLAYTNTWA